MKVNPVQELIPNIQDDHTSISKKYPGPPIWLAGYLTILLVMLTLAACGSQPSPTATKIAVTPEATPTPTSTKAIPTPTITPTPTSSLEVDESDLNGLSLTFWHPWTGATGEAVQRSLERFNAENEYGITVEGSYQGDINSLYERLDNADSNEGLPNLAIGSNYQILTWEANEKGVVDLNLYLKDPEWGFSNEELSDFNSVFLEQDVSGQRRFGFPALRSTQLMFYNQSWAEELGFTSPPSTPEEFKEQACRAAQNNNSNEIVEDDGTGGWLVNTSPSATLSWFYAFESPIVLSDGSGYNFNTPQAEDTLSFLKELIDEGCAWEVIETQGEVEFADRRALFITSSLLDLRYQKAQLERLANSDEWMVTGFPTTEGSPIINVYGPSFVMFSESEAENLAAWLVIKWLVSAEQQADFITASGSFPTRTSAMDFLGAYASENPHWASAQGLLEEARAEPNLKSWNVVRWVVSDVGTQVFRYYYTPETIPATLELMQETAAELHERSQ